MIADLIVKDTATFDDANIDKCCHLFNSDFEKSINGRQIKIYPSRMKRYLGGKSHIICLNIKDILIGYMIIEEFMDSFVWIKQIIIAKAYREQGYASRLIGCLYRNSYVGIITNNPIMIKTIKAQGYSVCLDYKKYLDLLSSSKFNNLLSLYEIKSLDFNEFGCTVNTHLTNHQFINGTIDISPLSDIAAGHEWLVLFHRGN